MYRSSSNFNYSSLKNFVSVFVNQFVRSIKLFQKETDQIPNVAQFFGKLCTELL